MTDVIDLDAFRKRVSEVGDDEAIAVADRLTDLEAYASELHDRFDELMRHLRDQKRVVVRVVDRARDLEDLTRETVFEIERARPRGRLWIFTVAFVAGILTHWVMT